MNRSTDKPPRYEMNAGVSPRIVRRVEMGATEVTRIAEAVRRATVRAAANTDRISILYSGGLDSSILAHLLRSRTPSLVNIGVDGSPDRIAAESGAKEVGLPLVSQGVTASDVVAALERWGKVVGTSTSSHRSIFLALALALEAAPGPRVVCGQGADELFLGYAHFRGLDEDAARARARSDLESLVAHDWPLTRAMAESLGKDLRAPFLDPAVVEAVGTYPGPLAPRPGELTKPLLRAVARELGLPAGLRDRPKKALQFGTGIARLLRELDRHPGPRGGSSSRTDHPGSRLVAQRARE